MIFQTDGAIEKIIAGTKTQTRRERRNGDLLTANKFPGRTIVESPLGRTRWEIGKSYAVQGSRTGPGKLWRPSLGVKQDWGHPELPWEPLRIKIKNICREDIRRISEADAVAEGYKSRWEFWLVWTKMHLPKVYRVLEYQTPEILAPHTWQAVEDWAAEYLLLCEPVEKFDAYAITFEVQR